MTRVLLVGEGATEIGTSEPGQRTGVLDALLDRLGVSYEVVGRREWRKLKTFQRGFALKGKPGHRDGANVKKAALLARESRAKLVFVRDRDREKPREDAIEVAVAEENTRQAGSVVGGTANEDVEAWLLALKGETKSEQVRDTKAALKAQHRVANRGDKIALVADSSLDAIPADASSLKRWIARARGLLS